MKDPDIEIERIIKTIEELCAVPSPSGFTEKGEQYVISRLKKSGYTPTITNKHSIIADLGGEGNPLVLAAHIDTLGAMVRAVKKNGRLRISRIGGYPEVLIDTENCIIHTRAGREFSGTVQLVNPAVHVNKKGGDEKRDDKNIEVVIDEKVNSAEEVAELTGIRAGDFISFDPRTVVTESGFIKSRFLDDKASASILLNLAENLGKNPFPLKRKVYLLFTVYEEVGHGGSAGLPSGVTEMISVDMGAVGDDLEADEHKLSICAKDSQGPYDYELTNKLIDTAERLNLNYAVDIYPFYGSDADSALRAGYDIRHGLLGPGVSASHGYERTHKEGLENTYRLLLEYIGME